MVTDKDWDGAWPRDLLERWSKFLQERNLGSLQNKRQELRELCFWGVWEKGRDRAHAVPQWESCPSRQQQMREAFPGGL